MENFKGTKGEWKSEFRKFGTFPKGEWSIKADNESETPIGVLPEPLGGIKDDDGISPKQKANAQLIAAAPELLEALIHCKKAVEVVSTIGATKPIIERAEKAINKALNIEKQ